MKQQPLRAALGLVVLGFIALPQSALPQSAPARASNHPNLVIFIADDHGYGDLGCYGHPTLKTPHMDQLAREGMRFEKAFLTISSCSPSRCSILTGRYPHNTGAEDLHEPLPADQASMARYLQGGGYYCAAVGKWHLGAAERQHWDRIVDCSGGEMERQAVEIVKHVPTDRPFFLWVASKDPHRPYQTDAIPAPHSPADVVVPPYLPDHPAIRKELALYYDEIARFDACVGAVRQSLAEQDRLNNTIVVYMSDNGMPFPRAKTTLYDAGIRSPLIVCWPTRVPANTVQPHLFSCVDLAPTLLALAGVQQDTMQGQDASAMCFSANAQIRDAVFAEANWHDFEQFTRSVRDGKYKLIRNYYWDVPLWNSVDSINSITWQGLLEVRGREGLTPAQAFLFQQPRPFEELYVLDTDPHELHNVVDHPEHAADLARLRTLLDNWRVETRDVMPETRRRDGWTRDGDPLPHNQPWYDRWLEQGQQNQFERY